MQLSVHVLAGGTRERFGEALLEVFGQKRVQNRIDGRVCVRQAADQQHEREFGVVTVLRIRILERQIHLADPIWQPTHDVDGDHGQHQDGHLAVALLLLFRLVLRIDCERCVS